MPDTSNVNIKGIREGLLISLDSNEEWQIVLNDLTTRIDENSAFFAGARITVDIGSRPVPKYALRSLKAALERRGLTLSVVMSESQTTLDSALALDLRTNAIALSTNRDGSQEISETLPINPEEDVLSGVMIRKTLRSGRTIHSDGHVIVMGDVNPGAQIVAGGDVVVWGVLRGNVHAGAFGDENAVVCALDMMPTQLRIAGYLYSAPAGNKRHKSQPETVYLRDDQIIVSTWSR